MFHFGQGPRINPNAKIIQVEILPEQCHVNRTADVTLVGDCKIVLKQLISAWKSVSIASLSTETDWWKSLKQNVATNQANLEKKCKEETVPLGYHFTLKQIADAIDNDAILVSEGANTLDMYVQLEFFPSYSEFNRISVAESLLRATCHGVGWIVVLRLLWAWHLALQLPHPPQHLTEKLLPLSVTLLLALAAWKLKYYAGTIRLGHN